MNACVLSSQMDPDQIPRFLEYAMKKQETINNIHVEGQHIGDAQIRKILDVCHFSNNFLMSVNPSLTFQHQFVFEEKNSISLRNAFWFNLENLFKINSRFITIYGSKYTNVEINKYLKKWMNGPSSKIGNVFIEMEIIDTDVLLAGLNAKLPNYINRNSILIQMEKIEFIPQHHRMNEEGTPCRKRGRERRLIRPINRFKRVFMRLEKRRFLETIEENLELEEVSVDSELDH
ncbi:unnamed protein product [Caenorhabditis brenneri]